MSWFDICKKTIKKLSFPEMSYSEINEMLDTTDFSQGNLEERAPEDRWQRKVEERRRQAKYLEGPTKPTEEEEECPSGTLWCEEHEECENEKYWHTHNSLPTKDDMQWGGGGKGPSGSTSQSSQKTTGEGS